MFGYFCSLFPIHPFSFSHSPSYPLFLALFPRLAISFVAVKSLVSWGEQSFSVPAVEFLHKNKYSGTWIQFKPNVFLGYVTYWIYIYIFYIIIPLNPHYSGKYTKYGFVLCSSENRRLHCDQVNKTRRHKQANKSAIIIIDKHSTGSWTPHTRTHTREGTQNKAKSNENK